MDVETVQKINDLAIKLQQQGNMSKEEALKQAEQMLSKDDNKLEVNEISDKKVEEMDHNEEPKTNMTWQEAMEKNTKFIVSTFKDIQSEIVNIKSEMDNLRNQIKNIKLSPPPAEAPAKVENKQENTENTPEKQEKHPKQGDCNPSDFSVEKMFYCGNK